MPRRNKHVLNYTPNEPKEDPNADSFSVSHNNEVVAEGLTYNQALEYIHNHQPQSWAYAFTYGGWWIIPVYKGRPVEEE